MLKPLADLRKNFHLIVEVVVSGKEYQRLLGPALTNRPTGGRGKEKSVEGGQAPMRVGGEKSEIDPLQKLRPIVGRGRKSEGEHVATQSGQSALLRRIQILCLGNTRNDVFHEEVRVAVEENKDHSSPSNDLGDAGTDRRLYHVATAAAATFAWWSVAVQHGVGGEKLPDP